MGTCLSNETRQDKSGSTTPEEDEGDFIPGQKRFHEHYGLGKELGCGAYSIVREGTHRQTGAGLAVKMVHKSKLDGYYDTKLRDEIQVLSELNHKHVIRLYEVIEEPHMYYLIFEKMGGGELFNRIVRKRFFSELEVRDTGIMLLNALAHCHDHMIAHRDIKPENILFDTEKDDANLKLADFGLAKKLSSPDSLTTQCGTPAYVAPEILSGNRYGTQVDMWSFGVIIYILLGGYPPFHEEVRQELYTLIKRGDYEFHSDYWSAISVDAKNLIARCLTVDPQQRYTARTALKLDKWMTKDATSFVTLDIQKKQREPSLERTASLGHYASSTSLLSKT